jgi:hypothetical protein
VLGNFFALKNPTASAGFKPANLGTRGQHASSRPLKPLHPALIIHSICPPIFRHLSSPACSCSQSAGHRAVHLSVHRFKHLAYHSSLHETKHPSSRATKHPLVSPLICLRQHCYSTKCFFRDTPNGHWCTENLVFCEINPIFSKTLVVY